MAKIGSIQEVTKPDCIQALIVEFIATFLFIFAEKLVGNEVVGLFFVAMVLTFVVAVMISAAFRISGGHLNPAVTLGLCVDGHITVVRSIPYRIDQLLASIAACALLSYLTKGLVMSVHTLAAGMESLQGVIMEIVLTFSLLCLSSSHNQHSHHLHQSSHPLVTSSHQTSQVRTSYKYLRTYWCDLGG